MTDTTNTTIHHRTLLVWLQIGVWSARKYDRHATNKVITDHNATSDAARVTKALLPTTAPAYRAIMQAATAIRTEHYRRTLAWSDEGWRLLPTADYLDYTAWFRGAQTTWSQCKTDLEQEYPALRQQAPQRLNGLWNANDYPDTQDVISKFTVDVRFSPVPAAGDIRVDLGSDQIAAIEANVGERVATATSTAMADAWQRLHDTVAHIAERLDDPDAIFRDSLIENARTVCDTLKRLNITDDPNLEAMRARVEQELTKHNPTTLRNVPSIRSEVAETANSIMASMAGFYGGGN